MLYESKKQYGLETEITKQGAFIRQKHTNPEAQPIFLTTAFNVEDLDDLFERYDEGAFCYNRGKSPNRSAMVDLMNYLEQGEDSIICSSGMAAICSAIMAHVEKGDHILSDKTLYGETFEIFEDILVKYGVTYDCIDCTDLEEVMRSIKPNTKIVYAETASNPMCTVVDVPALAEIAHKNGALLIIDNTFMTPYSIRPNALGADMTIDSLTKFGNGHFDAVCGSVTGKADLIKKCHHFQELVGTQCDGFTAWLTSRGLRTFYLRQEKQQENAEKLAAFLEESPYVKHVYHPSVPTHPQHELARKQFNGHYGAMMSIDLIDGSREKVNAFIRALDFVHYAMTLGGYRTTIAHPCSSSHYEVPEEKRLEMGIKDNMIRISVGIENAEDIIADFKQALEVFK